MYKLTGFQKLWTNLTGVPADTTAFPTTNMSVKKHIQAESVLAAQVSLSTCGGPGRDPRLCQGLYVLGQVT